MATRIDYQDYVRNPERSRPGEAPTKIYVIAYISDGEIIWSFPSFYEENIMANSKLLSFNHDILEYDLVKTTPMTKPTSVKKIRRVK